ncbi:MAG: DHH family phosphoesterase [Clostridia bacterium]|nr:DHH family phosphoesterase [Clostridia bacterium]
MNIALLIVILAAAAAAVAALFFYSTAAGIAALCVWFLLTALSLWLLFSRRAYRREVLDKANQYFAENGGNQTYPMAVAVTDKDGMLLWYNRLFEESVLPEKRLPKGTISEFLGDHDFRTVADMDEGLNITYNGRYYTVYAGSLDTDPKSWCFFFVDDTALKHDALEYRESRPCAIHIKLDNLDEIYRQYRNSECEVISGEVETILEGWAAEYPCSFKKLSGNRYLVVMEERGLQELRNNRFEILKRIRDYQYGEHPLDLTVSIGIGRGGSLAENDEFATMAMEMAQSRGGDQAAINTNGEYEFFGGTVGGTTKSSKVKARSMATALADHIVDADAVFVSGHQFADLDSIGSCMGVYEMAYALGKPCYVLLNRDTCMAQNLVSDIAASVHRNVFVSEERARLLMLGKKTLLVVVDTHRPNSLEYPDLTDKFDEIAVIDHHRRTANYLKNTVLFYDEPNASSASEMITELLQYIPAKVELNPMCAEALLSGIMLDTRNFVLSTGVRTFEAAAYLKSHGADTVSVKQLFANSMENYKAKSAILGTAFTYKDCAIAVTTDVHEENMRIIASQVADDLMSVVGIRSSYVVFQEDGTVSISARSLGAMNVQRIMEKLGGGGHLTMAATQMTGVSADEAVARLEAAITEYLETE